MHTEQVADGPALLNQPTPVSLAPSQLIMLLTLSPTQPQLHSTSVLISSSHILTCHHSCSLIPLCYIHLPMPAFHLHVRNPLQLTRFSFVCCPTLFCQTSAKKKRTALCRIFSLPSYQSRTLFPKLQIAQLLESTVFQCKDFVLITPPSAS